MQPDLRQVGAAEAGADEVEGAAGSRSEIGAAKVVVGDEELSCGGLSVLHWRVASISWVRDAEMRSIIGDSTGEDALPAGGRKVVVIGVAFEVIVEGDSFTCSHDTAGEREPGTLRGIAAIEFEGVFVDSGAGDPIAIGVLVQGD